MTWQRTTLIIHGSCNRSNIINISTSSQYVLAIRCLFIHCVSREAQQARYLEDIWVVCNHYSARLAANRRYSQSAAAATLRVLNSSMILAGIYANSFLWWHPVCAAEGR